MSGETNGGSAAESKAVALVAELRNFEDTKDERAPEGWRDWIVMDCASRIRRKNHGLTLISRHLRAR